MTTATVATTGAGGRLMIAVSKRLNPLMFPLASRGIGVFGVIQHRGRSSGRLFSTPVAIRRDGADFVIPLPYGPTTDWCRNVLAAQHAVVRIGASEYQVARPEIVGLEAADRAYNVVLRRMLRLFGIRRFLVVRRSA